MGGRSIPLLGHSCLYQSIVTYCVPKIEATINRLGGLDENSLAPRKFYELPEGSAQQLAFFEQESDYELDE